MKRMKSTLNAGCGAETWGDVRVDIERNVSTLFQGQSSVNVIADVQFLPFRNQSFSETKCFHVLEHVDNPKLALSELRRVSEKVVVRVPIWHLYCFLIESMSIVIMVIFRPNQLLSHLQEIRKWKRRYGTHKWYVRFRNPNVNRRFGIPREYEKTFLRDQSKNK